jgi:hypothetical protein
MKSNRDQQISPRDTQDIDALRTTIKKEKEALLSMFLANASISELSHQYKVIDELNERVVQHARS